MKFKVLIPALVASAVVTLTGGVAHACPWPDVTDPRNEMCRPTTTVPAPTTTEAPAPTTTLPEDTTVTPPPSTAAVTTIPAEPAPTPPATAPEAPAVTTGTVTVTTTPMLPATGDESETELLIVVFAVASGWLLIRLARRPETVV
jgi:LPXTG-motif cell wall-anchored protein